MQPILEEILRRAQVVSNGRFTFSAEIIPVWMDLLEGYDFSAQQLKKAADNHFRSSRTALTPADLIEQAEKITGRSGSRTVTPNFDCTLCDDEGWVLDSEDRWGWAVPCSHFVGQTEGIRVKPGHTRRDDRKTPRGRTAILATLQNYWATIQDNAHTKSPKVPRRRPQTEPGYDPDRFHGG